MRKVGLIFECGSGGADKKVCEYLARQLVTEIEIESVTLDNKPSLLRDCGAAAAELLRLGCERVLVLWDLYPAWRERGEKPCRKEDREAIMQSLRDADASLERVHLICIREELEAWLIADERGLTKVLSRPAHPYRAPACNLPERKKNPKKYLMQMYQQRGRMYVDHVEAERIIRAFPELSRLRRRCPTFVRFCEKLTG